MEEAGEFSLDPGGLDVSTGRDNLVVRAFESLHSADGIAFRLRSEIPLARGLGSSAAAIVAGLFAADHLFELALSKEEMLVRATELEGHPDNVAAAIYGGFVDLRRTGRAARRSPPASTRRAGCEGDRRDPGRGGLDRARPRGDPGRGAARPTRSPTSPPPRCWSSACRRPTSTSSPRGLADRIHQPRRRDLYPRSMELVDSARRARRPRRDDLRRRPDRARLDHLAGRRQGRRGAGAALRRLGRGPPPSLHPPRRRRPGALNPRPGSPGRRYHRAVPGRLRWVVAARGRGRARSRLRRGAGDARTSSAAR